MRFLSLISIALIASLLGMEGVMAQPAVVRASPLPDEPLYIVEYADRRIQATFRLLLLALLQGRANDRQNQARWDGPIQSLRHAMCYDPAPGDLDTLFPPADLPRAKRAMCNELYIPGEFLK